MRLSKYEQETILLTNEEDNTWEINTFNKALQKKLKDFARKYPEHCRLAKEESIGSKCFIVDKARVTIRLNAPYSEERKKEAMDQAKRLNADRASRG